MEILIVFFPPRLDKGITKLSKKDKVLNTKDIQNRMEIKND